MVIPPALFVQLNCCVPVHPSGTPGIPAEVLRESVAVDSLLS